MAVEYYNPDALSPTQRRKQFELEFLRLRGIPSKLTELMKTYGYSEEDDVVIEAKALAAKIDSPEYIKNQMRSSEFVERQRANAKVVTRNKLLEKLKSKRDR